MKVAICDDERFYMDGIEDFVRRWQALHNVTVRISKYRSSEDLLMELEENLPEDLFFLDIQFPGEMNGLQLAQEIRRKNDQAVIVFTTNYEEYAIEGYRVNALRYLQKPISDEAVFECLDIAYRQWMMFHDTFLVVESGRSIRRISYKSIYYIESKAHYIEIHTIQKNEIIEVRGKLGDFMKQLPDEIFVRCHRSYLVNLLYVQTFSRSEVVLFGEEKLPVSARHQEEFMRAFKQFFSRK